MLKRKTSELSGSALDWAVAKLEGVEFTDEASPYAHELMMFAPSTDWAQGGPIIERERIGVVPDPEDFSVWIASVYEPDWKFNRTGPTPLIAAMRCYVASKLGDEVEVPDELA